MLGISKTVRDAEELERELREGIGGEVHLDRMSRGLYSTDASIYQLEPIGVVVARDRSDVAHALAVARRRGLKVLPRGGGTSLAGQGAGHCLIIDTSKYMNAIVEVNEEERWVRVEPGRVRDELNAEIAATGLHFAPETATSNRANVGGMIGNNSSGTKSIYYGKTIDHVLELNVLLPTGEELHCRPMSRGQWDEIARRNDREGEIYRAVAEIIDAHRDEIEARYPKVMRRVGGYNLDAFLNGEPWNLAKLICGSEGTLAATLEAKLNLEPLPKCKAVAVAHFRVMPDALRAVQGIVPSGPSAVEILDRTVIELARGNLDTRRMCDWVEGSPAAVLLIEFFGESESELDRKFEGMIAELDAKDLAYSIPVMRGAEEQAKVWGVRAAGLGLMLGMKGDSKPTAFIEDSAVPVEVLPEYIEEVLGVCRSLDVDVAMYAHASVGLIHVRPILNLKDYQDVQRMKEISERTFELVQKYGGSWSGEHGDGLVRSYQNERFFGKEIYEAFRRIKRLFDPDGMMNPGKIVDAQPMDENLRLGAQYRNLAKSSKYYYREDGGFDRAVEMCSGVGACRKTLGGTMCPSYIATRDEAHSTRGRANALRLAMTGQLGPDAMTSQELYDVFDLCLSCKGCKAECPSNVDVAKLKSEFLSGYHKKHGSKFGEKFFANSPAMARRISGPLAPAANWAGEQRWIRALMEKTLGLSTRRPLPKFAREPFDRWFEGRGPSPGNATRGPVVLFEDTFMNYHEPSIGRAAVGLLERLGYSVQLAKAGCCCRPLLSKGFLDEARLEGQRTLSRINDHLMKDLPVVVCEPSCLSALTDDLPDLIESVSLGRRVSSGVMMIDVFLQRELEAGRLEPDALAKAGSARGDRRFLIHGHCHQKALYGTAAMKELLGHLPGAQVEEIDSGCCGMAGSFGYEREHYDLSLQIGEDRLFPAIRQMERGTNLIACGFSCRHQISDALGVKARHFVEVLSDALDG